jgi:PAS domain S-box-containing protein
MKTPRALATLAAQLADPAIITDQQGNAVWINSAFTDLCGYTLAEMKGRKPGHLLQGPDSDPATVAELRRAVREQRRASVELVNYRKNGEPYAVWITLNPLHDRTGRHLGFMAVERETSLRLRELRRLENEVTDLYGILCRVGVGQAA